MALDTFVAGAYSGTWNGTSVGLVSEGYRMDQNTEAEEITGDYYGRSVIEGVAQGGNVFIEYECLAYKAGSLAPFFPFGNLGEMAAPGVLYSDLAKTVVLTSTTGTPAVSSPASLTGSKAMLAAGHNAQLLFASRLRRLPIRQRLLPYISGVVRWYTLA